jgi:hypothetical protein
MKINRLAFIQYSTSDSAASGSEVGEKHKAN